MLTLTSATFAKTEELFKYKEDGFKLSIFPGYDQNQWGIKAHNRPWIVDKGKFKKGQEIIEVGGAYSTLPEYLAKKYNLRAWVGDDFGYQTKEKIWSRWGNPHKYALKHKLIKYIFKPFGEFSPHYPDKYFDRIFSVSTLEHIDDSKILNVLKDMNRCTKDGGMQLHTIDIMTDSFEKIIQQAVLDKISFTDLGSHLQSQLKRWESLIRTSGVKISTRFPSIIQLFDRKILVESPDVVFKYYPPINKSKRYQPSASLLIVIEDL